MSSRAKNHLRELFCKTGYSFIQSRLLPTYPYMFNPAQLTFLCDCLSKTAAIPGPIVEIGANAGHTTIFLGKYLDAINVSKRYICIDAFSGFMPEDIEVEVKDRAKPFNYQNHFQDWTRELFQMTMDWNGLKNVNVIQADINVFDERSFDPPSFCLVDVDLYRPTKAGLNKFYHRMPPGAMLVIDDCVPNSKYDGAYQAYQEFVRENGLSERYEHGKLGVVRVGG